MNTRTPFLITILVMFVLLVVACNPAGDTTKMATIPVTMVSNADTEPDSLAGETAYPVISDSTAAYPVVAEADAYPGEQDTTEGVMNDPPDPERNLIVSSSTLGAVGGVLIQEIAENNFVPITPRTLYLADVLENRQGEQALLARGEDSPKAELFSTGVFAFGGVQPGTYGLVIDLGFTEYPLLQDGTELLVVVEAGKVFDLGQIFVEMPNQ